jgi:hypothetical protein
LKKETIEEFLAGIKSSVKSWRKDGEKWLSPDGNNSWVVTEFEEKLEQFLVPTINNMVKSGVLTLEEACQFESDCREEWVILVRKANDRT